MGFITTAVLLLLCFHAPFTASQAADALRPGQSISLNQTLVSANLRFALGFFSPSTPPSNYYLGIWFNQIPNQTVVWVANRDSPIPLGDSSSISLTLARDGNLAVVDEVSNVTLWSTNASSQSTDASATLLNSGNLVITGPSSAVLWQSFDHPTNTLLANMKLYMNLTTGTGNRLVAWTAPQDPSTSEFSVGFDEATAIQIMVWRGSNVWIRAGIADGQTFTAARGGSSSSFIGVMVDSSNQSITYSYQTAEGSDTLWVMLDSMGAIRFYIWRSTSNTWDLVSSEPVPCTYYNPCGPNALCYLNSMALECNCVRGYVPQSAEQWRAGSYTRGCRREVELKACGGGGTDGFATLSRLMLPDGFKLVRDASREECESGCLKSCNCSAYAFSNASVIGSSTRCLVWEGDLVDVKMKNSSANGEDLFLRLDASAFGTSGSSSKREKLIIGIVVPLVALGMILVGASLYIYKSRTMKRNYQRSEVVMFEDLKIPKMDGEKGFGSDLVLDFAKLVEATDNFSSKNKIGEGGFGLVYKGTLNGGQEIAIKTLSKCSTQGFEQFRNEVELIARLQHKNLVKLVGWCIHSNEKMLIYEYLPNKSLDKFIFVPSLGAELNWEKRFHIIQGIAQGLLYLHRYSRLCVIHRDLKTSNILLDGSMNPKISDFGLAKIINDDQYEGNTERVTGTLGYMSPEYAFDGLFSEKSDVFSFGVILLEIITGKKVTGYYPYKKSFNLLGYVWEHWKEGRVLELVDPSMGNELPKKEILRCFHIALLCVQESAMDRPSTTSIVQMLSRENPLLPTLKQPAFSAERNLDISSSFSRSLTSISVDVSSSRVFSNDNIQGPITV